MNPLVWTGIVWAACVGPVIWLLARKTPAPRAAAPTYIGRHRPATAAGTVRQRAAWLTTREPLVRLTPLVVARLRLVWPPRTYQWAGGR